ncbi:MAG TPA: DegT/DnrJ/EryC1/StrS family aminotransferase, partial [Marmoricola sp.]|nr:DegT/DnrJ/EryC1/StrS family aminotransferase [Marmoricola sp.]
MTLEVLLSSPDVGEVEQSYVLEAMRSGWIAPAGPDLDAFEREIAERVGAPYAVGLASGTAGLHLALVSWGVGPGDVVPVSTLTFAASVNAIHYTGATPYLIDSDPITGNMSPELLAQALRRLREQGASVPVVMPVDLLGKCVDHEAIAEVVAAEMPRARILSDAAESLGASRNGTNAGAWGDAAVVSFNGNKIITTSGGGMLLTADEALANHVRKLSTQAREPVPHYEHTEVGYNYRLSNILAALGRAQLSRLDEMLKRRRRWREEYRALLASRPGIRILGGDDDAGDNCWLTAVIIDPEVAGFSAQNLGAHLLNNGIESRPLWKPMHLQPV